MHGQFPAEVAQLVIELIKQIDCVVVDIGGLLRVTILAVAADAFRLVELRAHLLDGLQHLADGHGEVIGMGRGRRGAIGRRLLGRAIGVKWLRGLWALRLAEAAIERIALLLRTKGILRSIGGRLRRREPRLRGPLRHGRESAGLRREGIHAKAGRRRRRGAKRVLRTELALRRLLRGEAVRRRGRRSKLALRWLLREPGRRRRTEGAWGLWCSKRIPLRRLWGEAVWRLLRGECGLLLRTALLFGF